MKQISANITGSFILNGTDLTNTLGSSSIWSGSFSTRVSNLESFSSSLDATFATDAQLAAVSASLNSYTASNNTIVTNLSAATASLNTFTGSAASRLGSLEITSGSNITRISALEVASGSAINRLSALETASGSAISRLNSLEVTSGSNITRLTNLENRTGSYATTGSNTFVGGAYFSSSFNPTGFTTTASLYTDGGLRVTRDAYISGTLYLNNVTVFGTQSIAYISSSQLNIGTNIITVNTDTPSVRFGGLAVYDSGSTGLTGSILWDSQANHWVYSNPSGSSYSGGMFISGPRTSTLGSETGTTACMLLAGQGGDHLTSSMIYHSSTATCFHGNSFISSSGAACFSGQVCAAGNLLLGGAGTANTVPQYTAAGVLGNSKMTTYGNGCYNVNFGWSNCARIGFDNDNTGTYFYGLELDHGTRRLNIIGKAPDGNSGVSIWTGTTSYDQRFNINASGIACFACQVCAPSFIGGTVDGSIINSTSNAFRFSGNNALSLVSLCSQNVVKINAAGYWGTQLVGANDQGILVNNTGNVGIGTAPFSWASGWRALEVGASGVIAYTGAGSNDLSYTLNSYFDSSDNRWEYRYTGDGAARYSITALTSEHRWFNAPVGTANAAISWTQAMTLTSTGNLGIGTSTPCASLHVVPTASNSLIWPVIINNQANCPTSGYGVGLRLQNSTTNSPQELNKWAGVAAIAGGSSGYSNETDLAFYVGCFILAANCTCPPVEKMRIQSSTGNVGIGTTSPCARLHIQGTGALQDLLYFCTGGSVNTKFVYSIASGADDAFVLRRNHTTQGDLCIMSWTYNGNVGIGSTSPSYQLDMCSGTTVNQRIRLQRGSDDTNQNMLLGWNNIVVTRSNVSISGNQTDFSIIQCGSDGARVPFNIGVGGHACFICPMTIGTGCRAFGRNLTVQGDVVAYYSDQESVTMGISAGTGAQSWGIQVCDTGDGSNTLHLNARGGFVGINKGAGNTASYPLDVTGVIRATGNIMASCISIGNIGHYNNYSNSSGCFAIFCASQGAILYVTSMHNGGRATYQLVYSNGATGGASISVNAQTSAYGPACTTFALCANGWVYAYQPYGGPTDYYAISMNSNFAWGF